MAPIGAWRSLVARAVRVGEVPGSNPGAPIYTRAMLGLPDGVNVLLFDLDGVLTDTASVHQKAWKEMFDDFLREREGEGFEPFSPQDYERYVDGKPRYDGVRSFLEARGIEPEEELVTTLGDRKNDAV